MRQPETLLNSTNLQEWDGRIVNAAFPLRQCLGGSEHSAVYLTARNGAVATIKLISAIAPEAQAQLAAWELAARLSHPNLISMFETGIWHADGEQDMYFAVMEYCEESLAGVLRERPLTRDEARAMLVPVLDALQYLHGQGILHGQVDPKHILASGDRVKLSVDKVHRNGERHPSQHAGWYDAPEKPRGTISLSGDVWSLGVTLTEALTQSVPTRDESGRIVLSEKLPSPFAEIVAGCLTYDREARISISAIRKLLDSRPASPTPASVPGERRPEPVIPLHPRQEPGQAASAAAPQGLSASADEQIGALASLRERRRVIAIGVAVAVVALLLGIFLTRRSSAPGSVATAVAPSPMSRAERSQPASSVSNVGSNAAGTVVHQVMPEISSPAKRTINGTVKVRIKVAVDQNGQVIHASVAERGPSKYFAEQSERAAQHWSFTAPVREGKPQPSVWIVRFEFRKNGTKASATQTSPQR